MSIRAEFQRRKSAWPSMQQIVSPHMLLLYSSFTSQDAVSWSESMMNFLHPGFVFSLHAESYRLTPDSPGLETILVTVVIRRTLGAIANGT